MVETETLDKMKVEMEEKDTQIESLKAELAALQENFAKSQEELEDSKKKYQQMLKMQAMQAGQQVSLNTAAPGATAGRASTGGARMGGKASSNRNVDIQLVG